MRMIAVELVHQNRVVSYQIVQTEDAKELLARPMNPGWRYRIMLPERTGNLRNNDDERYAQDCIACDYANPFENA